LAGGAPGPGVVVEGCHRSQIRLLSFQKYATTAKETGGFVHFLAKKSPKTPFFAQKYLTRYTHEMFFEEYINFIIVQYLSYCGVIPV
jgi:hypothetical protein